MSETDPKACWGCEHWTLAVYDQLNALGKCGAPLPVSIALKWRRKTRADEGKDCPCHKTRNQHNESSPGVGRSDQADTT